MISAIDETTVAARQPVLVDLALQGGGSHGAFTWGVLDRLLQEGEFAIDSVSGTSAGAMNAVVLADGLARGGADAARQALQQFWVAVAAEPGLATFLAPMAGQFGQAWNLDNSPAYVFLDMVSRVWSPYDFNPLVYHPLRGLLAQQVDFERLHRHASFLIFLGVKAGKVLADDFSGGVTLEALRAGIPGGHNSRCVQQQDGVVGHCLDKQTVPPIFR